MNDAAPPAKAERGLDGARMETYFRGAAFATLLLVGFIATLRLYFALEHAIVTWLRPQYTPLAQAAFSLAVLALVVWLMRTWLLARRG